ncbi:hypothetical protein SLNWT_7099 [Streptomyces albus]|uniref:Uncharacterized protein n=1 Tax=Streptomyces albus (strain ATCC 21838 / DSM 41398 / FERM P-419 / JCM 4703 / NBRC 107858) TaxID=1081613 RepID=A0A0B5F7C0_STRA4|nr:hypothetical protein SLNWT_7099 [Streptomyces albus]AOU81779.1 hypothetical protein SLNHY_7088 [Streptomyces albus]AYN37467.1 hypothetical protein DUI70_6974 [Streptomyces albus]
MNVTHTLMALMGIGLAVVFSFFVAGVAFAIARWGGSPVPESVSTSGKAFATALMVISAVLAVVLGVFK